MVIVRRVPEVPANAPRRGNRISSLVGRLILTGPGWRVEGNVPDQARFVIVWAPHTSYWDWLIYITTLVAMRLEISWMAASELFWWPLGPVLHWLGGVPIDRSARHGVVNNMIHRFAEKQGFILSIAPEGTRSKVQKMENRFLLYCPQRVRAYYTVVAGLREKYYRHRTGAGDRSRC